MQLFAEQFRLSPRQTEVLHLTMTHLDNRAIADEMGIEQSTLRVQLERMTAKLGLDCDGRAREAVLREFLIFFAGRTSLR